METVLKFSMTSAKEYTAKANTHFELSAIQHALEAQGWTVRVVEQEVSD